MKQYKDILVGALVLCTLAAIITHPMVSLHKSDGSRFDLQNASDSSDVSYRELWAFLDALSFEGVNPSCGFAAEFIYNEAEQHGIRVYMVASRKGNHAWNMFTTTDQGRVYIDATGGFVKEAQRVNGEYVVYWGDGRQQTLGDGSRFVVWRGGQILWWYGGC